MPLDRSRCRELLRECKLQQLFVEELGWDRHTQTLEVRLDGRAFTLSAIAHKHGMVAFECPVLDVEVPDYSTRRKIQTKVARAVHEHLITFVNEGKTDQVWQWVKREPGRPRQCREHRYHHTQPGDSLLQKLEFIAFTLDEEADLTLVDVTGRVRAAFDVDRVTRRFYDRFKSEHTGFSKFLKGIPDEDMQRWYVSVMLNRLMFIYFIQKRGFLDGDVNYLREKLAESKRRGRNRFYRDFLCPLFFEGFAKREEDRSEEARQLLGGVPYLNGGIFMRHQIEELHGETIQIANAAFDKLFAFFDAYQWHLDERPLRKDDEINPDVLGYIFEKYINQKQMGAYYSKEDITGYISQNTVVPHLLDAARQKCRIAFEGEQSVWRLLQEDPDRYLYPAVRSGVIDERGQVISESALPDFVQTGMHDPKARMFDRRYNLGEAMIPDTEGKNLALPTETWREYVERRTRCLDLRAKLAAGEVADINDLITYNLDIRQFAQDVIENCEGPELLRAFWQAIQSVSVLDPACGSGAFLFAALNILEPLYEACLERMEGFLDDLERSGEKHHPRKFADFRETLERVDRHPNRRYFILKSIVLNNLFGVDIMEEAVEICKLRLFLKLVAQVETVDDIEPLPDIDFNIQAGNSLVGFASYDDVKAAVSSKLDFDDVMGRIEEKARDVDRLFALFRQQQTELGGEVTAEDKAELRRRLAPLEAALDRYLAGEYGVDLRNKGACEEWRASHKPFHWFIEFYGIMGQGGFDAVIGNPPYVSYADVRHEYEIRAFETQDCSDLYAYFLERTAKSLLRRGARSGMIVPISSFSTDGLQPLQQVILRRSESLWVSSYAERPSKLFTGAEKRLSILLSLAAANAADIRIFTTSYNRWQAAERPALFEKLSYAEATSVHTITRRFIPGSLPKAGSRTCVEILTKLSGVGRTVESFVAGTSPHHLFYTRKLRYFIQFFDFVPKIVDGSGQTQEPSELKRLCAASASAKQVLLAALNSSLFFWFFVVFSDCRNVNRREILTFPIDVERFGKESVSQFGSLAARLMRDFQENSQMRRMKYPRQGTLTIQSFQPRESKVAIDEIDESLGRQYGFTEEEVDWVVNHDIKHRMGM